MGYGCRETIFLVSADNPIKSGSENTYIYISHSFQSSASLPASIARESDQWHEGWDQKQISHLDNGDILEPWIIETQDTGSMDTEASGLPVIFLSCCCCRTQSTNLAMSTQK